MPVQSLRVAPKGRGRPVTSPPGFWLRRAFVIGGAILLAAVAAREMYLVLSVGALSWLEWIVLGLFVVLSLWIAFSFTSAIGGVFPCCATGAGRSALIRPIPCRTCPCVTALLMPTYNEPPGRVFAGLEAIIRSLDATGRGDASTIFILSDTTDADIWVAEEAAYLSLRERLKGEGRIFLPPPPEEH